MRQKVIEERHKKSAPRTIGQISDDIERMREELLMIQNALEKLERDKPDPPARKNQNSPPKGSELGVSFFRIREYRKPTEFTKQ